MCFTCCSVLLVGSGLVVPTVPAHPTPSFFTFSGGSQSRSGLGPPNSVSSAEHDMTSWLHDNDLADIYDAGGMKQAFGLRHLQDLARLTREDVNQVVGDMKVAPRRRFLNAWEKLSGVVRLIFVCCNMTSEPFIFLEIYVYLIIIWIDLYLYLFYL